MVALRPLALICVMGDAVQVLRRVHFAWLVVGVAFIALLGDRCRITGDNASDSVFVRSLPTPSGQQGVAPNIELMLALMKSFGFDRIFIETVGAGQTDTAIRQVADTIVLVVQPHTGDELQWEKAGILEIADIVVVNKSDLPGAEQTIADIAQQLHTSKEPPIPVVKTSVARQQGIDDLGRTLDSARK